MGTNAAPARRKNAFGGDQERRRLRLGFSGAPGNLPPKRNSNVGAAPISLFALASLRASLRRKEESYP